MKDAITLSSSHFSGAVSRGFTENYAFTPANNFRAFSTGEGKIQMSHFALFNNTCYMRGQQTFKISDRAVQLNTRAQRAAAGDGFMLADLLQLQNGKKKSETAFNTSPFYGR